MVGWERVGFMQQCHVELQALVGKEEAIELLAQTLENK